MPASPGSAAHDATWREADYGQYDLIEDGNPTRVGTVFREGTGWAWAAYAPWRGGPASHWGGGLTLADAQEAVEEAYEGWKT